VVETSFPLPVADTVINAVPFAIPVTAPELLTVATAELLDEYANVVRTVGFAESTRATSSVVTPRPTDAGLGVTRRLLMAGGSARTVTVTESVRLLVANPVPLPVADTTITAEPAATPVISPAVLTVATDREREVNACVTVTAGSARSAVIVNCCVRPTAMSDERGATVKPRSAGTFGRTVTLMTCDNVTARVPPPLPSTVTVMLAVPGATPTTRPESLIVATAALLVAKRRTMVTFALSASTVADNPMAAPTSTFGAGGVTTRLRIASRFALTVTCADAAFPLSSTAVIVVPPGATPVTRQPIGAVVCTRAVAVATLLLRHSASRPSAPAGPPNCAARKSESPTFTVADGGEIVTVAGGGRVTETVSVALIVGWSTSSATIDALPAATAVMRAVVAGTSAVTVATVTLELRHRTAEVEPVTVAPTAAVAPRASVIAPSGFNVIAGGIGAGRMMPSPPLPPPHEPMTAVAITHAVVRTRRNTTGDQQRVNSNMVRLTREAFNGCRLNPTSGGATTWKLWQRRKLCHISMHQRRVQQSSPAQQQRGRFAVVRSLDTSAWTGRGDHANHHDGEQTLPRRRHQTEAATRWRTGLPRTDLQYRSSFVFPHRRTIAPARSSPLRNRPTLPLVLSVRVSHLLLLSGALTGCGRAERGIVDTPRVFTVGIPDSLESLEPAGVEDANGELVVGLMFEGLTRIDSTGQPTSALAERWETTDQRRWRFVIRPSAVFHDGTPVRAANVLDSWAPRSSSGAEDNELRRWRTTRLTLDSATTNAVGVAAPDSMTVQITLPAPDASLPAVLAEAAFWVRARNSSPSHPIGSGPWRLARGTGSTRSLAFARVTPRAGTIDSLRVSVFQGDRPLEDEIGRDGTVDWTLAIGTRQYAQLALRADLQLRSGEPVELRQLIMALRRPALRSPLIRKAIAHAIDRRALLSARPGVPLEVAWGILPRRRLPGDAAVVHQYDPKRARELLQRARYDSASTPIRVGIHRGALADSMSEVAWHVRNYLLAVGMRAELYPVDQLRSPRVLDNPAVDLGVYINYADVPTDAAIGVLSFQGGLPPEGLDTADAQRMRSWSAELDRLSTEPDIRIRRAGIAAVGDSLEQLALSVRLWWQPPLFACSLRTRACPAQILGNRFEDMPPLVADRQ
jgi:ABC-type transport system substrate-binding protein